jgi:hypothetical protein
MVWQSILIDLHMAYVFQITALVSISEKASKIGLSVWKRK